MAFGASLGNTKTRGLNFEDTRLADPAKLHLMTALVALDVAWSVRAARTRLRSDHPETLIESAKLPKTPKMAGGLWCVPFQTFSHFLRQVNGLPQVAQVFRGRSDFFIPRGICDPSDVRHRDSCARREAVFPLSPGVQGGAAERKAASVCCRHRPCTCRPTP